MSAPARVHRAAIVHPEAILGDGVEIGPYAIVGAGVVLGPGVRLHAHAVVEGRTELGAGVEVFPSATLGLPPQDTGFDGAPRRLVIGPGTIVREHASIHGGSRTDRTEIGGGGMLMAYVHVGHDARIGERVIVANATQIAGHVEIGDGAVLGGGVTVHQHVRIGRLSMTGASARVRQDVPPFLLADGDPARVVGTNRVGLARAGVPAATRDELRRAFRVIFRGSYARGLAEIERELAPTSPAVAELCAFLRPSRRGVMRARRP